MMPKRIPITAAKHLAQEFDLKQVILFAWDGKQQHCVTYGASIEDCDQAAQGGNRLKAHLGWPESLMAEPSRVKKLKGLLDEIWNQLYVENDTVNPNKEWDSDTLAEVAAIVARHKPKP
jgi:hypothetical protein